MITEQPKTSNKLLANSAKQYIKSASWNELVELMGVIKQAFVESCGILGFWCTIIQSDNETTMLITETRVDSAREKLLLLGALEEAKYFIHTYYRDLNSEETNDH